MTFTETVTTESRDESTFVLIVHFQDGEEPRVSEAWNLTDGVEADPRDARVIEAFGDWLAEYIEMAA